MKKLIAILAIILLLTGTAYAAEWSFGSGQQTGVAAIVTGPGIFDGIIIATDGSSPVTVDILDSSTPISASVRIIPTTVITTSAIDRVQAIRPPFPVRFFNGLSVSPTSVGTYKYVVYYR
jgi:hypothetical protein